MILGFVHKDSAATYFITYCTLMGYVKSIALVFQRDESLVEEYAEMVEQSTAAEIIKVKAFHNPNPLKVNLDKALNQLKDEN